MTRAGDPLKNFVVRTEEVGFVGKDLQRPACLLAEPDGTLWSADARGGLVRIDPGGAQQFVPRRVARATQAAAVTNGLAFTEKGDLLVADFATGVLEVMSRDGESRVLHDRIDGRPIGKLNFILPDSRQRLWLTVSTRRSDWFEAMRPDVADGYIAVADHRGIRIVADGLPFPNEVRLDQRGEFLYIAETTGRRVSRMRVGPDASLSGRETYGPSDLGPGGFPDGIVFDAHGNLWVAVILGERLIAITPDGDVNVLWDLGTPAAIADVDRHFPARTLTQEHLLATRSRLAPAMVSITFGGPDLRTAYIGTLGGQRIPFFRSPVAGLPLVRWAG